ncbi:DUF202 domain-containing protein [Streptomyces litchfieldiae]|uniref:DUF202 domain-containing protein n=1 Tax=Streptomyces litchfieldiae TaxID=3075543 RepID=A0ABU2MV26_9ACTN|nr:DUF202 domain-containing protein [Streptomyces sp. DSM 44938]MDT0345420.1 DUF202 domain-containing protein [Streptomyces sp. DSM 44938]
MTVGARGNAEPPARDPGAQPERTRLAWRRTTLTFALVVVLAARGLVVEGGHRGPETVAVALAALLWVAFLAVAHRRLRALTEARPGPPEGRTVAGAAGIVVVAALVAAVALAVPG